ncbi:hypothetical protein [Salegentibacter flavus]|uniref:hypothetical protein n=1 Tax=Salegentibacter flavus TaxID=287099 RepID=UPI001FE32B63|nr:hypothetical protein [Salegentibacter flavus]
MDIPDQILPVISVQFVPLLDFRQRSQSQGTVPIRGAGIPKALPEGAYELKGYRRAKVQKMGYVYFSPDKSYSIIAYPIAT